MQRPARLWFRPLPSRLLSASADQLEAIDPQSIALYAWTGTAWAQLPQLALRSDKRRAHCVCAAVRAVERARHLGRRGQPSSLPYVAQPGPDVALNAFEVTQAHKA